MANDACLAGSPGFYCKGSLENSCYVFCLNVQDVQGDPDDQQGRDHHRAAQLQLGTHSMNGDQMRGTCCAV